MTTIHRQGNEFSDLAFNAEQLQRDVQKMQSPESPIKPLPGAANPVPVPGKTAVAKNTPAAGGGGIASPIKENALATREYHAAKYITTSDGLFAWPAIKTMKFTDAAGRAVQFDFAEPS